MMIRKLQSDIDRTLKKVSDGIAEFECVLQKINAASTANQKEKLEADLKREIKKLQKLRDQIKCWISNNEVKNKDPLLDSRKKVELQMEKYKEYERRSKTKAYSKEGLQRTREREQMSQCNITEWLQDRIKELKRHIEVLEMELEGLDAKRRRAASSKLQSHNFHLNNLERLLRRWENESIDRHLIESVKDDIDYYVDKSKDTDSIEDVYIYNRLGLDVSDGYEEVEETESVRNLTILTENLPIDSKPKKHESKKIETISEPDSAESTTQNDNSTSDAPTLSEQPPLSPSLPSAELNADHQRAESPKPGNIAGRFAKISAPSPSERSFLENQEFQVQNPVEIRLSRASQVDYHHTFSESLPKSEAFSSHRASPVANPLTLLYPQTTSGHTTDVQVAVKKPAVNPHKLSLVSPPPVQAPDQIPSQVLPPSPHVLPSPPPMQHVPPHHFSPFPPVHYVKPTSPKPNASYYFNEHDLDIALSNSYHFLPEPSQPAKPPFTYSPPNPSPTPSYYPSKSPPDLLDNPVMFEKFSVDLLFYLFYYRQNTYQQYLAAKELKRQSWRYHTRYLTWFQRYEEPKCIKEDFEQGTYVYFDYEIGWCQRKKMDFTFNYAFLEGCSNP